MIRKLLWATAGAALVLGALTACSSAAPEKAGSATPSVAINWPTRGDLHVSQSQLDTAVTTWSRATRAELTAARVLFAANSGIVGLTSGQCQLMVVSAVDSSGQQRVGWFISPNDLGSTASYAGQDTPAVGAKAVTLLAAPNSCPPTGSASPVAIPASSRPTTQVRAFALAAPGYRIHQSASAELTVGEMAWEGIAVATQATSPDVAVDIYSNSGTLVGSTTAQPAATN